MNLVKRINNGENKDYLPGPKTVKLGDYLIKKNTHHFELWPIVNITPDRITAKNPSSNIREGLGIVHQFYDESMVFTSDKNFLIGDRCSYSIKEVKEKIN